MSLPVMKPKSNGFNLAVLIVKMMIWIFMAMATIVGPFDFDVDDLICPVFLRFLLIRVGAQ